MTRSFRSVRSRAATRLRRGLRQLAVLLIGLAVTLPVLGTVGATPASATAPDDGTLRVLLFYKPNFHASHVQARQAVRELAGELSTQYSQPLEIEETDDAAAFTTANLATKDAVVFAQTGGVLFNTEQRAALEGYIRGGGGYLGLHYAGWSVGQSEHDVNPFYHRLVGAVSEGHPEAPAVRPGRVVVKDTSHPLTQNLPAEFTRSDEWYDWVVNPAPNVRTLLEADEASYADDNSGGRQGTTHPITWCQEIDAGRSWYSGMGHEGTAYSEPVMRTQIRNGLAYAAGLLPADCSPPAKDEQGGWSGVTPWPLVAINASLTPDGKVQTFGSVPTGGTDANPYDWTGNNPVTQGGQFEIDVWDPAEPRTLANVRDGVLANNTYTDLFCAMQVQQPHARSTMTVGGDDSLGGNAPNDAAIGVTSYSSRAGLHNEAPMNYPRWYPTGTTMPNGDIVVQGGSLRGGPGGPGVQTPEIYTPDSGSGWKLLDGATSSAAYGDGGGDHPGQDENRWWYPRAFVTPGSGTLFNITGTQMYELDPAGNEGDGELTLRGTLPSSVANQGSLGNPVGATSTATMYRPGKILQVGGGWWANGGGPNGARAGFTVDITGGTDAPVIAPTQPMKWQRHWATSTVLPDGDVLVSGGGRENNGRDDTVTNPEIWDPDTGEWTTVEIPHEHARLYHSTALLLPDGRVMLGGGGAPGPRNYTDVEYYSPSYLFDGDVPAARPEITDAPSEIGYDGTFDIATSGDVSRVTLVRNGSVTHGFNNDQSFQDLEFSQTPGSGEVTITAPEDGTYAPPGGYMLFVFDESGTPSVASMVNIDPTTPMDVRTPQVVDQFEYPRVPTEWQGANPPQTIDVAPGNGRMAPWAVDSQVQLLRGTAPSNGGLGLTGYQLALGQSGSLERTLPGLDPGKEYRVSLRYARDSRAPAGDGPGTGAVSVGSLDATLSSSAPSQSGRAITYETFVGTFTADQRAETLTLSGPGTGAGLMIDDLVVISADPGASDVPIHYEFEEGAGTTAANTGTDTSVGPATLTGTTGWSEDGVFGSALDLPGGTNANTVDLPDNLLQGEADFTTSFWVRPDTKGNWINLFHIGDGLLGGDTASFFQIQMQTQAQGNTGLAATFKAKGNALQERVYATPTRDVVANEWNHVVFTRQGATGTLYLNGEEIASRDDLTIDMTDVGPTANNWLGRNGFPDPAFDGRMDDVRLYTSTLGAADVAGLYADGSALRTTTTVTVDPASPSPFGEPLDITAEVEDEDGGAAEGSATLWVDGVSVGSSAELADGSATFSDVALAPGEHEIEVRYLADEGWRDSTATVIHVVERPPPGEGVPIHYTFDEGTGTTAANSGSDPSVGAATLSGATGWTQSGQFGPAVSLPGGASGTQNQVDLPDNISDGMDTEFSVSLWLRPDALPNWVPHLQIGKDTTEFFLMQSSTENGVRGFAATFRADNGEQQRLQLPGDTDIPLNEWTHVVFTMFGSTGKLYFDGELVGERTDFSIDIGDVGAGGTTTNLLGGTSWPDPRYDGLLDDFRMYGYELTEEQVGELFEGEPENTAPVAVDDAYVTDEDEALTVDAPGVLANDTDADDDDLTAADVTQPANGEVTLEDDGSFTYTPDTGFTGADTFTYRANDGSADSAPATVQITVEEGEDPPGNDAPTAVADIYATGEDEPLTVDAPGVLANDTDPDDDELTAVAIGRPGHGEVTLNPDGSFTYTPDRDFSGEDSFVYKANDGTEDSNLTTVTIAVDEAPPAVTAVAGASAPYRYGQRGVVTVSVSPSSATGEVEVMRGSRVLATGTVTNGKARVVLPVRSLPPGRHDLTVSYTGDARHAASSSTVEVVVKKAVPTMRVMAPRAVDRGDRYTVTVLLSAPGAPVTGTVRVTARGRTLVGTVRNGRAVFQMPRATGRGAMQVRAVYGGSPTVVATTKSVTVRVRR